MRRQVIVDDSSSFSKASETLIKRQNFDDEEDKFQFTRENMPSFAATDRNMFVPEERAMQIEMEPETNSMP